MKIAIVAPSCGLDAATMEQVEAIAARRGDCELWFHPQCFETAGHFAGPDAVRLEALREVMADASIGAVWFARGGYGSNRIAEAAVERLPEAARGKTYLGYSDAGFLLSAFHRAGLDVAWGPMPQDIKRNNGADAVGRALDWLVSRDVRSLEPNLDGPAMAFNLTVLSSLLGTPIEPDFTGVDLLIEEVSEHLYRIDRLMFHVTAADGIRNVRRIRLGRVSEIPDNDPQFGARADEIVAYWCARAGVEFGGTADIGHDSLNRVVPFGPSQRQIPS